MNVDPAFRSVQKGRSGFYIWRIEDMKVVAVPREQYGSFYKGDSYIILSLSEEGDLKGVNIKVYQSSLVLCSLTMAKACTPIAGGQTSL